MFSINTQNFTQGYIPSPDDVRDFNISCCIPLDLNIASDSKFSWIDYDRKIGDQKNFGSCVAWAASSIKHIHEKFEGDLPNPNGFSPLYAYTLAKKYDSIPFQEGTYPRTMLSILLNYGILPEDDLPYDLLQSPFGFPNITNEMIEKARQYRITGYARITDLSINNIKKALRLSPILTGLIVTDSFIDCENGYISAPSGSFHGGHGVSFVKYDDDMTYTYKNGVTKKGFVTGTNSWNVKYGDKGRFHIPYDLINWKSQEGMSFISEMWSSTDLITKKKFWRIQIGAYRNKSNIHNLVEQLKKKGLSTYIPPLKEDLIYRCQLNCFIDQSRARKYLEYIKGLGYKDAFLVYN